MRNEQIEKIDEEIRRLIKRNDETGHTIEDYIQGRLDSLRWIKENL